MTADFVAFGGDSSITCAASGGIGVGGVGVDGGGICVCGVFIAACWRVRWLDGGCVGLMKCYAPTALRVIVERCREGWFLGPLHKNWRTDGC